MNTKDEIIDFISAKENNGALLITGQWGCGKSYLVKHISEELNKTEEYYIAVISLFGIQSVATLNHCVKEAYLDANTGFWGKTARKVGKVVAGTAKEGTEVAATVTSFLTGPASAILSGVSQGISSLMSINAFDLIAVKNVIERDGRKFVLVFDDFERCSIDVIDLLGAINEYCENKKIKTIVVCDEDHIKHPKYGEFKEKLISRTLRLHPNYNDIIAGIVETYEETATGYKAFLTSTLPLICQVFFESKHENLRTLKSFIFDFERIYSVWVQSTVPTDQMPLVLYAFGMIQFEYKAGNYKKSDKYGYLFAETNEKEKYTKLISGYQFRSLQQWVVEGIWDEELFLENIKRVFSPDPVTYYQLFLNHDFWNLDDEIIRIGLPDALGIAYLGGLSCQDLISLLGRIYNIEKYGITLPCEVDYKKLYDGFKTREEHIKNGTIEEPKNATFISPEIVQGFSEEAKILYTEIEMMSDRKEAWKNRREFITFMSSPMSYNTSTLRHATIVSFDDELLEAFVTSYQAACNSDKREMYQVLSALSFDYRKVSTSDDIAITIKNLGILISKLEELEKTETDSFSKVIIKETIRFIPDIIGKLSSPLEEP